MTEEKTAPKNVTRPKYIKEIYVTEKPMPKTPAQKKFYEPKEVKETDKTKKRNRPPPQTPDRKVEDGILQINAGKDDMDLN